MQTVTPLVLSDSIVLSEVPILGVDSLLPSNNDIAVAIDAEGAVVWFERAKDPLGTLLADTTSTPRVVRFGRRGDGPGELQAPWHVSLAASGPVVFEPRGRRLVHYARSGAVLSDRLAGDVVGVRDTAVLVAEVSTMPTLFMLTSESRDRISLTPQQDSLWRSISRRPFASDKSAEPYAATIVGDTVYLSMAISGELFRFIRGGVVAPFGVRVPPRLRTPVELDTLIAQVSRPVRGPRGEAIRPALSPDYLARARIQPIRQTSPFTGLQVDGAGRLWRFRDSNEGPVADVYVGTVAHQRVLLPCAPLPRGASIAGRWLLLACADLREESERDSRPLRFRF